MTGSGCCPQTQLVDHDLQTSSENIYTLIYTFCTVIGLKMCPGAFAKCLGISLLPLSVVCVLCNILLFFPGGTPVDTKELSEEVWYFGGILGSGVLVSGQEAELNDDLY